jgi:hypothetical protein
VDNGQCHNGKWDNATIGPWDNRQWDNGAMSNETMDIGNMEAGTMRSGTILGSNLGVSFCQLTIATTIIVIIVSIIIGIITIVCIHRPSSTLIVVLRP